MLEETNIEAEDLYRFKLAVVFHTHYLCAFIQSVTAKTSEFYDSDCALRPRWKKNSIISWKDTHSVDQSTGTGCLHLEVKEPISKLLSVIETLFEKIQAEVFLNDAIKQNYMGLSSDEGSNVSSEGRGLAGRLEAFCPYSEWFCSHHL